MASVGGRGDLRDLGRSAMVLGIIAMLLPWSTSVPNAHSPGLTLPNGVMASLPGIGVGWGTTADQLRPSCANCVVTNISLGSTAGPMGIAYDPLNRELYVAEFNGNVTAAINGTLNTVSNSFTGFSNPDYLAVDPANQGIYVANYNVYNLPASGYLTVINGTTGTVGRSGGVGFEPAGVAYDSSNRDLYVVNYASHNVTVLSGATNHAITSIVAGTGTRSIAFDPANGDLYATNAQSNNLTIVNGGSNTGAGSVPVGNGPYGIAYDASNGDLYVSDTSSGNVTVVQASTGKSVGSIPVGTNPEGIAVDSALNYVYVANQGSANVSVVNASSDKVVASINVQTNPMGVAYDSSNQEVYVTNYFSGTVSVISPSLVKVPTLSYVSISPSSLSVSTGGTATFTATLACSGGPCPSGATYSWSLTNGALGTLNSTTAKMVLFTAGSSAGTLSLHVNVTLGSQVAPASAPITISAPTLTSVSVTPSSSTVTVNGTQSFTATPACSTTCPGSVTYSWTLNNSLGKVSPSTGPTTTFTAGASLGAVQLSVTATLNTGQATAYAAITIAAAIPTLSSISVSPTAPTVAVGNTVTFTPTPNCNGGTCPSGTTYTWALNDSLGTLSTTAGPTTTFTAGSTPGGVILFATGTLNGRQANGLADITIAVSGPTLTALSLTPSTPSVLVGRTVVFATTPTCSVSPCPGGVTFRWTLSNPLGNLSSSTGSGTTFTAGSSPGSDTLSVVATLGTSTQSATATITLSSVVKGSTVAVTPGTPSADTGGSVNLLAAPSCSPSPCPAGVTFEWTLNNSLGSLNVSTGSSVDFTAGGVPGLVTVSVVASSDGHSANGSVTVTITSSSSGGPTNASQTFLGLPDDLGYVLVVAVVAGAVAVAVVVARRKRTQGPPPGSQYPDQGQWQGYGDPQGYPSQYGYAYPENQYPGAPEGPWGPPPNR